MTDFYSKIRADIANVVAEIEAYRPPAPTPYPAIIDIYGGNKLANVSLLKEAGIVGIIHQASQGTALIDDAYAQRRGVVRQSGLLWGAYHLIHSGDGVQQADLFLRCANPDASTLVALDFEDHNVILAQLEVFVERVHSEIGRWPVLYTSAGYMNPLRIPAISVLHQCSLWIASYTSEQTPTMPAGWKSWSLWQWQPEVALPGVSDCDVSKFNGTLDQLRAWWSK